jgi:Tol biopolymer transport system component
MVAYQSDQSGRFEIYVQPVPEATSKIQISSNGGAQVRWARNGKELFFVALDGGLMAVPIVKQSNAVLETGIPSRSSSRTSAALSPVPRSSSMSCRLIGSDF